MSTADPNCLRPGNCYNDLDMDRITLSERPLIQLVLSAAFIAVVSFGAIGGVLAAVAPEFTFGLTRGIVCPRSDLVFDSWYDGEANQFRVYCVDAAGGESADRTLAALGVILGGFFIAAFWIAFAILLILRAAQKRKYGV